MQNIVLEPCGVVSIRGCFGWAVDSHWYWAKNRGGKYYCVVVITSVYE